MTLRLREGGELRKVGRTTMASDQNPHSGLPLALKKAHPSLLYGAHLVMVLVSMVFDMKSYLYFCRC